MRKRIYKKTYNQTKYILLDHSYTNTIDLLDLVHFKRRAQF